MTEYEIRNKIYVYENRIREQKAVISKNEELRDQLLSLNRKLGTLENDFQRQHSAKKNSLSAFSNLANRVKAARSYFDGMTLMLNGRIYNNAVSGFHDAENKTNDEIINCERKIEAAKQSISSYNNLIYSLRRQLALLQNQENAEGC